VLFLWCEQEALKLALPFGQLQHLSKSDKEALANQAMQGGQMDLPDMSPQQEQVTFEQMKKDSAAMPGFHEPVPTDSAGWQVLDAERQEVQMLSNVRVDQVHDMQRRVLVGKHLNIHNQVGAPKADASPEEIAKNQRATVESTRFLTAPYLPVELISQISSDPAAATEGIVSFIRSAHDNLTRCMATVESLLDLPVAYHPAILEAFEWAKLRPDTFKATTVPEAKLKVPKKSATILDTEEALERALSLELRLLGEIDRQRRDANMRTHRERTRERESLHKEAKELGIDIKRLQINDLDRLREAVIIVKFAQQYYPNDPLHNGIFNISPTGELRLQADVDKIEKKAVPELLPKKEEHAVLVLTHMLGMGFPMIEASHVANVVLKGELGPQAPSDMDVLERAQRARRRTSTLVGQALLTVQLGRDTRLTADDINRVVAAVRTLEHEAESYLYERTDPLSADMYDDEFGVRNTLLPGLRTSQTLPGQTQDMLAFNAQPDDFDGETDMEREFERRDIWRRNLWSDLMATKKYETPLVAVNPIENPEIRPQHLDPEICRQVYYTHKANPEYWTPLRLSCQFKLKLERVEGILTLWYIEDCCVARGEIPSFESGQRKRMDGGPDDRHFDGVDYLKEDFVESSTGGVHVRHLTNSIVLVPVFGFLFFFCFVFFFVRCLFLFLLCACFLFLLIHRVVL
jgi:hypothetical protein